MQQSKRLSIPETENGVKVHGQIITHAQTSQRTEPNSVHSAGVIEQSEKTPRQCGVKTSVSNIPKVHKKPLISFGTALRPILASWVSGDSYAASSCRRRELALSPTAWRSVRRVMVGPAIAVGKASATDLS